MSGLEEKNRICISFFSHHYDKRKGERYLLWLIISKASVHHGGKEVMAQSNSEHGGQGAKKGRQEGPGREHSHDQRPVALLPPARTKHPNTTRWEIFHIHAITGSVSFTSNTHGMSNCILLCVSFMKSCLSTSLKANRANRKVQSHGQVNLSPLCRCIALGVS